MDGINVEKSVRKVTMKKIHCIKCNKYKILKTLRYYMFSIKS